MELRIADQQAFRIIEKVTADEALIKAEVNKMSAFGMLDKFTGFFQKPKTEDIVVIYKELRFQPFWELESRAFYEYDRRTEYNHKIPSDEVKSVILLNKEYVVENGSINLDVVEKCEQDIHELKLLDAITEEKNAFLKEYVKEANEKIELENVKDSFPENAVIVPPQIKISGLMRNMLSGLIKGIQADTIYTEEIAITKINLFYRPIYSFQYKWNSKNKEGILEIDGISGEVKTGTKTFKNFASMAIDKDFLFDIGADAAGTLIPGASIAVKIAKKYIDKK